MNCRKFQSRLYEYVEGSLSAGKQAAADEHLAQCHSCRHSVQQEQRRAQFLSAQFRQNTETLALRPEIRRCILASPDSVTRHNPFIGLWNRFAWPLGIAASLMLFAMILLFNHSHSVRAEDSDASFAVSVQVSYHVPTSKFRKEGNLVLASMSDETVNVSETLWTTKPIRKK